MPDSKNAFSRYRIIDKELTKYPGVRVKTKRIREIIEMRFGFQVSDRMIQNDIKAMKNDPQLNYFAPIEYDRKARAHYYSDPEYSIRKFRLKEEEFNALEFILQVFKQYSNHGILKNFVSAVEKIESALQLERNINVLDSDVFNRVIPETLSQLSPLSTTVLSQLTEALDQDKKVAFIYQKHTREPSKKRKCSPQWIKEYKGIWYLIATEEGSQKKKTFGLDRISDLKILDEPSVYLSTDISEYYKYCFGITANDALAEEIIFSCTPITGEYIKSNPLHDSQKVLLENEHETRIYLNVIPSFEFYASLLYYGQDLTVISPKSVRDKIAEKLTSASKNYTS